MRPKPIADLVQDDLLRFPIWEYASDGELEADETYVRPIQGERVPSEFDDDQVYHVACDMRTAHGKELIGFMSLCRGELHDTVPVVVGASPGRELSLECPPHRREKAAFEAFFGAPFELLFPVRWKLRAYVGDERSFRSGKFEGLS